MKLTILALVLMLALAGCTTTAPATEMEGPEQVEETPPAMEENESPAMEEPEVPVEEPEEETPAEEPAEPEEPREDFPVLTTSKTAEELLDGALDSIMSDYYREHSGMYQENRYRWIAHVPEGDGSLVTSPAAEVEFEGTVIDSVRAAGYQIFEKEGNEDVYAVAVFNQQQTQLDNWFSPFGIELLNGRDLGYCRKTQKDVYQWSSGGFVSVYMFECESAS